MFEDLIKEFDLVLVGREGVDENNWPITWWWPRKDAPLRNFSDWRNNSGIRFTFGQGKESITLNCFRDDTQNNHLHEYELKRFPNTPEGVKELRAAITTWILEKG